MNEDISISEAKKKKSTAVINAFIIGFLIGIIIYSVAMNTWGFLTLIPLYFIYKILNNSKKSGSEPLV